MAKPLTQKGSLQKQAENRSVSISDAASKRLLETVLNKGTAPNILQSSLESAYRTAYAPVTLKDAAAAKRRLTTPTEPVVEENIPLDEITTSYVNEEIPLDENIPLDQIESPTMEDVGAASGASEAQDIINAKAELANRQIAAASPTEIRGGLTDSKESALRTYGFIKGVGSSLGEMGEDLWKYAVGDAKPEETEASYIARKKEENKLGMVEKLRNSPTFKSIKEQQKERIDRYEDEPVKASLAAFFADAGDVLLTIPTILTAPFSEFEVEKTKTSEQAGYDIGEQVIPTVATATAMALPGVDLVEQLGAAPVSTVLTYIPLLQGIGKLGKLGKLATIGKSADELNLIEKTGAIYRSKIQANLAEAAQSVAQVFSKNKKPVTSQWIMDRFYNKDPAITALMEEAFAEGRGAARAIEKLTTMYGEAKVATDHLPGAVKKNARVMSDIIDEMAKVVETHIPENVMSNNGKKWIEDRIAYTEGVRFLKDSELKKFFIENIEGNELLADKQIFSNIAVNKINDVVSKSKGKVTWDDLIDNLEPILVKDPTSSESELFSLFTKAKEKSLLENTIKEVLIKDPNRIKENVALTANYLKDKVIDTKVVSILGEEGSKWTETFGGKNLSNIIERSVNGDPNATKSLKGIKPSVLNMTPEELEKIKLSLVTFISNDPTDPNVSIINSLYKHLDDMVPLVTKTGSTSVDTKMVIKPLSFISDQQVARKAFTDSSSQVTRAVNDVLKSNALVLNPKSIVSNIIGNISNISAKFGSNPFNEVKKMVESGMKLKTFMEDPAKLSDIDRRMTSAAVRTGIFDADRVTADAALYGFFDKPAEQGAVAIPKASLPAEVLRKAYGGAKKVGGTAMKWGDEAPKLRLFEEKFNEILNYIGDLGEADSVSFPTGPNTRMSIVKEGDNFRVIQRVIGEKKGYKSTLIKDTVQLDDAIARGAASSATDLLFDYSRVPGYMESLRRTPLIGASSPFTTYAHKAFAMPGIKGGIVSPILSATDGITSTSKTVNARLAAKGIANAARKAIMTGIAKTEMQDPDIQKIYGFDPAQQSGVTKITGPSSDNSVAMITNYSSANWLEGTIAALQMVEAGIDKLSDVANSSAIQKYKNMALDEKLSERIDAGGPEGDKLFEDKKNAYYAALNDVKSRGTRPEVMSNFMKLSGLGGSIFFDAFANFNNGLDTGKIAPDVFKTFYDSFLPNFIKRGFETAEVAAKSNIGYGTSRVAGNIPEGYRIEDIYESPALSYFFANFTGLNAMAVDGEKKAAKVAKAFKTEMKGRLETWNKGREAEMKLRFGDEEGYRKAMQEKAIIEGLIDDAAANWIGDLYKKGIIGKDLVEEYSPVEEVTPTEE